MRATIWIRKANLEIWEKLEDKSEFVNKALGSMSVGKKVAPPPVLGKICPVHKLPWADCRLMKHG